VRDPGIATFALLVVAVALIVAFVWMLRRKLRARVPTAHEPSLVAHGS
jgi:hypothetical protein